MTFGFNELRNEVQAFLTGSGMLQGLTSLIFVCCSLSFGVMSRSVQSLSMFDTLWSNKYLASMVWHVWFFSITGWPILNFVLLLLFCLVGLSLLKSLLSAEAKQNNLIYNRQVFATSILRPLHQVYENMLNYMNKCVYLPKWHHWNGVVRGVRDVWGGKMDLESDGKAPPAWDILTNIEVEHAPSFVLWFTIGGSVCEG